MAGRARRAVWACAAAVALSACERWECDFYSHGACISFPTPPADVASAQQRMDRLLELELPFWGLSRLSGWRIQFRDTASYPCYMVDKNDGCTDYLKQTISIRLPPEDPACFEAGELLHELGHYTLGDPMHSSDEWGGVEGAFQGIVWNRPDAPAECVVAYRGIVVGMWVVHRNAF